jgi:uncharacterized protein (DUF1697 family)
MAQLRRVLAKAGFENVRTYIQSGNALVDTDLPASEVEQRVRDLIRKHLGPDLVVVVRTGRQIERVLAANPFTEGYDIARVFFTSLAAAPAQARVRELLAQDFAPEKLAIVHRTAYVYLPGSAARSRLSNNFLERKLGVSATTRNFNTLSRLVQLSRERLDTRGAPSVRRHLPL